MQNSKKLTESAKTHGTFFLCLTHAEYRFRRFTCIKNENDDEIVEIGQFKTNEWPFLARLIVELIYVLNNQPYGWELMIDVAVWTSIGTTTDDMRL